MRVPAMVVAAMAVVLLSSGSTQTREVTQVSSGLSATPAPEAVLTNQRVFTASRARRQPVIDLLADSFVEIQWDGGVLTRGEAVDRYERYDDVSADTFSERWTASYGNVAVISERTGEEGTPYSSRRLYIWVREEPGSWRLLLFQRTFMFVRTAKLGPHLTPWPAKVLAGTARPKEEEMLATRNPVLAKTLAAPDAIFFNGHGEPLTSELWSGTLDGAPSAIRFLHRLYSGDATVFIGEETSQATAFPRRFTHIWTGSPGGLQLRFSQTTYQALEDSNPDSKFRPVIPQT